MKKTYIIPESYTVDIKMTGYIMTGSLDKEETEVNPEEADANFFFDEDEEDW